ncbi:MAG TPA: hypothetical protein VF587_04530 [Solirubrobacteraceae bacterium]
MRRLLLIAPLTLSLLPAPAGGATKLETHRETASREVTFDGVGCEGRSERTLRLARGAFNVSSSRPELGTQLVSSSTDATAGVVESVTVRGRDVTWTVRGAGEACEPGMEDVDWETEATELRSTFLVRRRVLTRGTVIRRGDAICRSSARKVERIARRFERLDESQFGEAIDVLRDFARAFRGMRRRLSALAIPKERARFFSSFVGGIDRAQERIDAAADAAEELDIREMRRQARRMSFALTLGGRNARRYGFHDCLSGVQL